MRELQLRIWCDMHEDGQHVPASSDDEVRLVLDGKPRVLDLCAPCRTDFQRFYDMAREPEARVASRPTAPAQRNEWSKRQVTCPAPSCSATMLQSSLSTHVRRVHGIRLAELRAGGTPGEPSALAIHECPEPDCAFRSVAPQGVASHRRIVHGRTRADIDRELSEHMAQRAQTA